MFKISQKLNAKIINDDGTLYKNSDACQYDPKDCAATVSANTPNDTKAVAERNAFYRSSV